MPVHRLTDLVTLKSFLQRHRLLPTKDFGQHFLIDANAVDAILGAAGEAASYLEIGPGPGVLTGTLSERARTTAIDIDQRAVTALAESAPKAHALCVDVLSMDLNDLISSFPKPLVVVSNMPYNITGPLLGRFADISPHFERAVLMMQREVGDRLIAQPGMSDFGAMSIFIQSQFRIRKVIVVPPDGFFPPPKVHSVVLELTPDRSPLEGLDAAKFFKFTRQGFKQPRKTLSNNLAEIVQLDGKSGAANAISSLSLPVNIRPHQVTFDDWKRLYELVVRS